MRARGEQEMRTWPLFRGVVIVVAATLGIWPVWAFCQITAASSLSPADAELFRAGLDAQRNQDLKAAEKDYSLLVERLPQFLPARFNLGLILDAEGSPQNALEQFLIVGKE